MTNEDIRIFLKGINNHKLQYFELWISNPTISLTPSLHQVHIRDNGRHLQDPSPDEQKEHLKSDPSRERPELGDRADPVAERVGKRGVLAGSVHRQGNLLL